MFTGILAKDSSSLTRLLEQYFSLEIIKQLNYYYLLSFKNSGCYETRTPGMNFNPRPARVAEILLREGKANKWEAIAAGFLACCKEFISRDQIADMRVLAIYCEVKESQDFESICNEAKSIIMALSLDNIRHAHLSDLNKDQLLKLAKKITDLNYSEPGLLRLKSLICSHPFYKNA